MSARRVLFAFFALLSLFQAPLADAQTCDVVVEAADGALGPTHALIPSQGRDHAFPTHTGHSYFVEVKVSGGVVDAVLSATGCTGTERPGVRNLTGVAPYASDGESVGYHAFSFTETADTATHLNVSTGPVGGGEYGVKVSDTTLYNPAWSSNGSFNTFYSFLNTTNDVCSGSLSLYDSAGTPVATLALSVEAYRNKATNTVALGAPRNKTGTARFIHDCPPGAFLVEASIANFTTTPPYNQPVQFKSIRQEH